MDPLTLNAAWALVKKFWYVLPILAMAGFVWSQSATIDRQAKDLKDLEKQATQLESRNEVTQDSLDSALVRIQKLNTDAEARAKRFQADLLEARMTEAQLLQKSKRTDAVIASLERSAADGSKDPCRLSNEAFKALQEL